MKRRKSPPKELPAPVRWFAQDQAAFDRLVALGARPGGIYRGWKGEVPGRFTMRKGEYLGVVGGMRAFGKGKMAMRAAMKAVHKTGAAIFDYDTGRNTHLHAVEMLDVRDRQPPPEDERIRRADARRKKNGQMLQHDAHAVWFGPGSVAQKAKITGWSPQALYDEFGKTNAPTGRPPKVK